MPAFTAIAMIAASSIAPWITYGLATTGLTVGTSVAVGTASANVIVGTTMSLITSKLFAPSVSAAAPKTATTLNQELAARVRGYGTMLLGGARAEWHVSDGYLYQVILCHTGEADRLLRYMIGDKWVVTDALNRVTTGPFNWNDESRYHVWLSHREGQPTQSAWAGSDATGSINGRDTDTHFKSLVEAFPGRWTKEDNFAEIACIFAILRSPRLDRYSKIFPEGPQTQIRAEWQLSQVLDPRTGSPVRRWSQNSGLCVMDYLTHKDGYRLPLDLIDQDSFAVFANTCDDLVPLKGGGTQPRYTLNGVYSLQDDPVDVLGRMRATCDAEVYGGPDGRIGIRGGKWEEPTVTITEDHILNFDLQQGCDKFEAFNELKITYTSPKARYQTEEATRWIDPIDQARRGVISSEFNVDMVHTAAQARRLAKIYRAQQNPRWFGSITTDLVGLRARFVRSIRLIIPSLGIDGPFLVTSHGINGDLSGCTMEVRWLGQEAYAWDAATEEDEEAPEIIEDDEDASLPVPTGLTLKIETLGSPVAQRVIVATVDEPSRDELELEAEITTGSRWDEMSVADETYEAVSGPVLTSQTYRVRARFKAPSGAVSAWTAEASLTVPAA